MGDCLSLLRPGVDICVLATPHNSEDTDDDRDAEPVWLDAKIRSIKRKPHVELCACQFYVSFYIEQGPGLLLANKKLSKETSLVKNDQIYVLQKLEQKPCDTDYYRWSLSEDCCSLQKFKLFTGRFLADLSWFLTASVLKQTAFNVRSIHNHIVYEISENKSDEGHVDPQNNSYAVNFKVDNEVLTPVILNFVPATLQQESDGHEIESWLSYDFVELRRLKRRIVQPERYLGCDNLPDYDFEVMRLGESKTYKLEYDEYDEMPLALSVQADNEYQKHNGDENWIRSYKRKLKGNMKLGVSKKPQKLSSSINKGAQRTEISIVLSRSSAENDSVFDDHDFLNFRNPLYHSRDVGEMVSKYFSMNGSPSRRKKDTFDFNFTEVESGRKGEGKGSRKHYRRRSSDSVSLKRDCVYVRESIYDVRSFRKGSVSAQLCRELIRRCMINIDDTLKNEPKQLPVIAQWKEFHSTKVSKKSEREEIPEVKEEELSEIDISWKEMEVALASWFLLDDNEDANAQPSAELKNTSKSEDMCEHDYRLNEQVGTVCQLCGFVETKIKDFLPPFSSSSPWTSNKDQRTEDDSEQKTSENSELDQFCIPAPSITPSTEGQGENKVWP